ncbi:MAG: hypothetical protein J1G02_01420 [Clostridiales bacterium]|nr:hypothetical protein [Clostridiales bacterium]
MRQNKENKPISQEEQSLKSYNSKMKREAVFKSIFLALSIGLLLSVIVSIVSFATLKNILWVALVAGAIATAGLSVLFYFKLYRPNVKMTAERVDEVGLEERVITMMQFKDQDNPMLNRQRQDAQTALGNVSVKQVKIRFPKFLIIALAIIAAVAIFMMSYSTVLAVNAENVEEDPIVEEEISNEDRIIRELIEALRDEIDAADIDETLRGQLHGLVDDLEASLKPEDSLEVKVAKIMDTADKIHRLIEEYLNRSTIAEELMKRGTTYELGKAIASKDIDKIREAFQKMYDSIEPLVKQGAYGILNQTADDIDDSLNAAINTPPALQKALEDLRDAFRRVFNSLEDMQDALEKDDSLTDEEKDQAMQDAIQDALDDLQDAFDQAADAMQDFFDQQQQQDDKYENLDDAIQDAIKDAMGQLGQDFEFPDDMEDNEGDGSGKQEDGEVGEIPKEGDSEIGGSTPPQQDSDGVHDTVIDGETSYKDVFDDNGYSDDIQDKLESGELSDEDRKVMQDYLDSLK